MRFFNFLVIQVDVFLGKLKVEFLKVERYLNPTSYAISFSYSLTPLVSKQFQPWCYVQHDLFIAFSGNMKFQHPRKLVSTIMVIIFRDFFMFYQIFLSLQVKQIVIISNKYTICLTSCQKIEIELFALCTISHGN